MKKQTKKQATGDNSTQILRSGTPTTNKKGLTARDLCRIIQESKNSGLASLKFGDLELQFHSQGPVDIQPTTQSQSWSTLQQTTEEDVPQYTERGEELPKPLDETAELMDKLALEDIESQMMIEDPSAFEDAQLKAGLEQVRVEENDKVQH